MFGKNPRRPGAAGQPLLAVRAPGLGVDVEQTPRLTSIVLARPDTAAEYHGYKTAGATRK